MVFHLIKSVRLLSPLKCDGYNSATRNGRRLSCQVTYKCVSPFVRSKLRHQAQSERFGYREVKLQLILNTLSPNPRVPDVTSVSVLPPQVVLKGDPKKLSLHGVRKHISPDADALG